MLLFKKKYLLVLNLFCFLISGATVCFSMEPNEVLVLANRNASQSIGLAQYYMKKRGIPKENLLLLWITDKETCSREDYEKKVLPPIRRFLNKEVIGKRIRCIVTIYGVPLRIKSPGSTDKEKATLESFAKEQKEIQEKLKDTNLGEEETKSLKQQLAQSRKRSKQYGRSLERTASFDSELTLVKKKNYDLKFWLPNPFFLGYANQKTLLDKSEVLMTSRLDGPSADTVKRIINDSIQAENQGLSGRAYFDARGKDQGDKKRSGYGFYDQSIHKAADYLLQENLLPVTKEDTGELFQPGACPNTALYCGWYSLAKYIDSFTWQTGSVGYHIASSECASLKKKDSQFWCKRMLDKGIAATIGPVGEPYVQSFPVPEIFFKHLTEGYLTLAEAYLVSLPYLSWKMVLVGDPLYRVNLKN